ncbi:MAG: TonB-dependent receptor domain-containing protein, partial [Longimicrobiales bacterium]
GFGSPDVMLIGSAQITSGSNSQVESRSLGYFVQEQIGWKDRLYLTGAVRADDHSAFGTNFDIIFYPKAQLAWILSEEPAFAGLTESLRFTSLKLRGAWGQAGRAPDPFTATQAYTIDKSAAGEEIRSALRAFRFGNPDLTAERGNEFELRFDAGLLDDRVGLELTYYHKQMRDVIVATGVAGSSGFGGTFYGATIAQLRNLGETLNTGVEMSLSATPVLTPSIVWEARATLATNHNELISFGDDRTQLTPASQAYGTVQQHRVGYPLAGYWERLPLRDDQGNPVMDESGVVQLDTSTFIGPSVPTREIALSNTLTLFRNLQLYALLDYKGGHYLFNYKEYDRCRFRDNCARLADPTNVDPVTGEALNPEVNVWRQTIRGAWIEKADFVKLRDLSLTYSLPPEWAQQFRASRASITLAGHNLAMWTDYSGIDPETNSYGNRSFVRADIYAAPMIRRLSLAVNLGF